MSVSVTSLASIAKQDEKEIVSFVKTSAERARTSFLDAAKGIVALARILKSIDAAKDRLKNGGVSANAIKNGMSAVNVWHGLVDTSTVEEAWFDNLSFRDSLTVSKAIDAGLVPSLVEAGIFKRGYRQGIIGIEVAVDKIAAPKAAAPAVETPTETDATETPAKADAKADAKTEKPTPALSVEKVEKAIADAQLLLLAMMENADEVTANRLIAKWASAKVAADVILKKRFPVDAASVKAALEQHVAA